MKTVLIEGASTAYGSGDPEYGGWASRLHRDALRHSMANPHDSVMVTNSACPGQMITRLNAFLEQDIKRAKIPHGVLTVVTSAGLNESKIMPGATRPVMTLDAFERALHRYAGIVEAAGAMSILMGPQRIDDSRTNPTAFGSIIEDDLVAEYGHVISEFAASEGIPFIDVNALQEPYPMEKVVGEDGLHPSAFGYELIYQATEEALISIDAIWDASMRLRAVA